MRQLVALVAILLGCETVLLILLGTCVSWSVPLFEITATALLGVAVFIYAKLRFGPSLLASLAADKLPSGTIMCGALLFVAAVLLILPGPMTDAAGFLLLIPWTRRMIVAALSRRCLTSSGPCPPDHATISEQVIARILGDDGLYVAY